ncbi:FxSxx-COOH system tetratricopeptide repeat protein [Spirillospora sp. NPDC048824]|uniref:FxSxx-COOH system tetratricopeptide repeat protein n=1 Tax=Spirillospora sp. NPDC048824 TaxID=3364526 RepID=UPI00371499EC
MISRLVEALWALDPPPTAQELADALWLAARMREAEGDAAPQAPEAPRPRVPADTPGPRPAGGAGPSQGHRTAAAGRDPAPQAGLYVTGREPGRAFPVRSPGVAAISHSLPLVRAMRPLRVTAPSPSRTYLDEAHTAQSVAETGVWVPVMRPSPERWLEMSLVVDAGRSMVIWQRTIEELRLLLQQLGAFRDVRVWRLDTDAERLRLRTDTTPGGGSAGQGRSPGELIDPTRRRVVLVVSDCLGGAWRDGRAAALLERWGRAGPVAIVQPLPQRLWSRCAAALEPVRFSTAVRAAPNDRLTAVPTTAPLLDENGGPSGAAADPGVAVPVMELEPRWVRTWAGFVAAGGRDMPGVALFTGRAVALLAGDAGGADPSPVERVMRFRAASSPEAFQLARHLAAAPLNLDVMRLVQRAMLPRSTPAHLAEVYLGDLMRTAGSQGGTATDHLRGDVAAGAGESDGSGGTVSYDFREGVRDVLLSGVLRGDALRVLTEVWHVVRHQLGSAHDFPALLGAVRRGEEILPRDQPFAQVAVRVLARLGGRYKEVAERLGGTSTETGEDGGTRPAAGPGPGAGRAAGAPPVWGGVPPRDPGFTGRDALLAATREALDGGPVALVPESGHRLGGEGTSGLAAEYAHRYAGEYDLVWWVPAAQATDAWTSLAALAGRLAGGGAGYGTAAQALRALGAGTAAGRWLLIYDDAADPPGLETLMPPAATGASTGHVLVTGGEAGAWAAAGHTVIRVGRLDRADSVAMLRTRAPGLTSEEAGLLARDLDDHPAALTLAAAWLEAARRSSGEDVRDYLRLLDRRTRTLGDERPRIPPRVAAAAGLAITRLGAERPAAGRLLELWTHLGSHPVSARMLSSGPLADLAPALAHEATLRDAMRDIDRYALGRFDPDTGVLRVHPQVRAVLRLTAAPPADHSPVRGCVDAILSAATPAEEPENSDSWEARAEITPHLAPAEAVLGTARHVVLDQVRFLLARGDVDGGRRLAEAAAGAWPDLHGPDDELLLEIGRRLAEALRLLGDHRAAAGVGAGLLPRMRSRFGPDHPGTLSTARGAGVDLRFEGRFREAYELDDDTWRRTLRRFGADDARSLLAAADVGTDLRLLGDVHHAHALDSDAHARLRRRLGPRHRDVVRVADCLSRDLHKLGRYGEALAVQRESLGDAARSAPPPPHVLPLLVTHAGTLRASGEPAEAHGVARETLDGVRRQFGADHPHTLAAEVCLALTEISVGVLGRARDRLREAHAAYQRVMGAGHPFTHVCAAGYGAALRAAGDAQTALEIDEAARAGLDENPDQHHALCCAAGVAADLYLLGEMESAAELSADIAAGLQNRLGPAHPHTLAAVHDHQVITQSSDTQSADALRTVLGDRHPDVAAAAAGELLELHIEPLLLE